MLTELGQTVGVDVLDAVYSLLAAGPSNGALCAPIISPEWVFRWLLEHIHAGGTSGDSSALLQALKLSSAGVLVLALHVIIVVVAASGADEERGRKKRRRTGTDLLDSGNI